MASFQATFRPATDAELYGIYVWAQHAVGALYPITQNAEVTLRNAIDREACRRFGAFWWRQPQFGTGNTADFQRNLAKAEDNLLRHWRKKERLRLQLPPNARIPTPTPTFTHDQILAATDFSTWEYVLRDDFASPARSANSAYLWPLSTSRVFRKYSLINNIEADARKGLLDLVHEVRNYRNRLFHHDRIWIMAPTVTDARTAIDTIRHKINRMELLIRTIEPRTLQIMQKVGIFACARRVCSETELNIYRYAHSEPLLTSRKKRVLRGVTSRVNADNVTAAWQYGDSLYGLYKIR